MALNYGRADYWRWNSYRQTVEFTVYRDDKPIRCKISRECIEDNLDNPQTHEALLEAAKAHFDQITDIAGMLITSERFEDDKSILIRSSDWKSRPR